jgi:hypothetical protein
MRRPGLFDFTERQKNLSKPRDFLEQVDRFVAWEAFRPVPDAALARKEHDQGRASAV